MVCTIRAISTLCPARSSHHHLYEFTCNNHRISGWNLVALIVLPDNWKSSQPVDSCTEAGGGEEGPASGPSPGGPACRPHWILILCSHSLGSVSQ